MVRRDGNGNYVCGANDALGYTHTWSFYMGSIVYYIRLLYIVLRSGCADVCEFKTDRMDRMGAREIKADRVN